MSEYPLCECDWKWHEGKPCNTEAHDHGPGLIVSPALCMQCLMVCCGERDDEAGNEARPTG